MRTLRAAALSVVLAGAPAAQTLMDLTVRDKDPLTTIGIPVAESVGLLSTNAVSVIRTATNTALPRAVSITARWGGVATDTTKPIKWLLVEFQPTTTGLYRVDLSGQTPVAPTIASTLTGSAWVISTQNLNVTLPLAGTTLISSLKLDHTERLAAGGIQLQPEFTRGAVVTWAHAAGATGLDAHLTNVTLLQVGDQVRFEAWNQLREGLGSGNSALISRRDPLLYDGRTTFEPTVLGNEQTVNLVNGAISPAGFFTPHAPTTSFVQRFPTNPVSIASITPANESVTFATSAGRDLRNGVRVIAQTAPTSLIANAVVTRTAKIEDTGMRVVIYQAGVFQFPSLPTGAVELGFEVYHTFYADKRYIRHRLRLSSTGPNGFRMPNMQRASHTLIKSMAINVATAASATGSSAVLTEAQARPLVQAGSPTSASVSAGTFGLAVPEFAETFPKRLQTTPVPNASMRYELLPDVSASQGDYVFEGSRARTFDFYTGADLGIGLRNSTWTTALLDPTRVASTGAVRPAFAPARVWTPADFATTFDPSHMSIAANRAERRYAIAYDKTMALDLPVSETAGAIPEYRFGNSTMPLYPFQIGWRDFGNLQWDSASFNSLHYDLGFNLMRQFLRGGNPNAFLIGSQLLRLQADWITVQNNELLGTAYNFRGLNSYEQGSYESGSGDGYEPKASHTWSEGLWLYWALTGDPLAKNAALLHADAARRWNFNYVGSNPPSVGLYDFRGESRFLGWSGLELVAAYRYTGNKTLYWDKAKSYVDALVAAEVDQGMRGYVVSNNNCAGTTCVQPWMYGGYTMQLLVAYCHEKGGALEPTVRDSILRTARWLVGGQPGNPVLLRGNVSSGSYLPYRIAALWSPSGGLPGSEETARAMLVLNTLTLASTLATGSQAAQYRAVADQLFRDTIYFRDSNPNSVPATPSLMIADYINFTGSGHFLSRPKIWGQEQLCAADYLATRVNPIIYRLTPP